MAARVVQALIGVLAFVVAAPAPSVACGDVPALGSEIDRMMATPDARKVHPDIDALRVQMTSLARSGDDAQARKLEEDAMRLLGFEKRWLRCGKGTFAWFPIGPHNRDDTLVPKQATAR